MPDEVVAMKLQLVLARELNMAIGFGEGEVPAAWFSRFPLLGILWRDGVELLPDDLGLASLIDAQGKCSSNEVASALLHRLVKAVLLRLRLRR